MKTPCFPAFRARLSALGAHVARLRQQSLLDLDLLFGPCLPPGLLSQADAGPNSRERIYNVRRTFFGFLYQVLNPQCPCRERVRQIQALFALHANGPVAAGTGGWCQARARLPWDILPRLRCAAAAQAEKAAGLWRGLRVKVVDGTSTSLPDTAKNQRAYLRLVLMRSAEWGVRSGEKCDSVGLQPSDLSLQPSVVAAAGATVLLVGFWFDGVRCCLRGWCGRLP